MIVSSYLKSRIKCLITVMLIIVVFASSYFLFDMPAITVLYPAILSLIILICVWIYDFARFYKKHKYLSLELLADASLEDYPAANDLIERDYQLIIDKLREEEKLSKNKAVVDYNNMVEYYTIWAHQIKTPIASMRLSLQSDDSELARKLGGDLVRIESYVEMVLTFLRLDSDSTDYVIKQVELDSIIKCAVKKFKGDFIRKKLALDYESTEAKVLTDEKWLLFVVEQIISNAVKYTDTGKISIRMSAPGILCIEDTGVGICPEDLPRIFENGYTGFNGRQDKSASGIGLYLCRRICDNLGHKISAQSTPGVGTKISIDLSTQHIGIE